MTDLPEIEPPGDQAESSESEGDNGSEFSGPRPIRERTKGTGGAVIGAAMLGLGQVYEPQNTDVNIEVEAELDSDGMDLDFGDLPGLE